MAGLGLFEKIKESYDADKVLALISAYYAPKAFTDWFQEMRQLHETTDEEDLAAENEAMEVYDQQYSSLRNQTRAMLIQQTARLNLNSENCDEILKEMFAAYSRLTLSKNKKTLNLSINTEQVDFENRQKLIVYVKQSISLQVISNCCLQLLDAIQMNSQTLLKHNTS